MPKNLHISEVCRMFSLSPDTFKEMTNKPSFELARQGLEDFKRLIRKRRRFIAKELHPDMQGGDDGKMKLLNHMVDMVEKIQIERMQRPQMVVHYHASYHGSSATSSTSWW